MKKCLILGGGIAGLTSAVYLSKSGYDVELIEASPKLGGRAYSFTDSETNTVIDNGQHVLMGCYNETLKFLEIIGSSGKLEFQQSLKVNFIKKDLNVFPLDASGFFYPLNLLRALLNYRAITFYERLLLLKFFLKLYFVPARDLKGLTLLEWLEMENQDENIRKAFWEPLAVSALNTNLGKASARVFSDILKLIFFRGNKAATIIIPRDGLSRTYCENAVKYIEHAGGRVRLSAMAEKIIFENDRAKAVITSNGKLSDFDFLISALPLYSLERIIPAGKSFCFPELTYSTILTVHLWLDENNLKEKFYGFIDSPVHWIFNHGTHITTVISDAGDLADKPKDEICLIVAGELEKYTGITGKNINRCRVIKEKRATFIPSNDIIDKRPLAVTDYVNFFLAGDWIETGLPSTIESAVKSGRIAAELVSAR